MFDAMSSFAGGVLGKAVDVWSAREASKDERHWLEQMSGTAYQRAVQDLRAAGLNPALAYQQGGASTPSTSAADTGGPLTSGVSSAMSVKRAVKEMQLMDAQIGKTNAEADLVGKTMPPADPWRILMELFGKGTVSGVASSAKRVFDYAAETAKTFPLRPQVKPYRQPVTALSARQREQLQRTGSYTRPARQH